MFCSSCGTSIEEASNWKRLPDKDSYEDEFHYLYFCEDCAED